MNRNGFVEAFLNDGSYRDVEKAIPHDFISFSLWHSFNGTNESYSWLNEHNEFPLFKSFGARTIPLIDYTLSKVLNLRIDERDSESISTLVLQKAKNRTLLIDPKAREYKDKGQDNTRGLMFTLSQAFRNIIAHGSFGLFNDKAILCNAFKDKDISIALVVKLKQLPDFLRKWMGFCKLLSSLTTPSEIISYCLERLGFKSITPKEEYVLASIERGKRDLACTIPLTVFPDSGNERKRMQECAKVKAFCPKGSIVLFAAPSPVKETRDKYLFVNEVFDLSSTKDLPSFVIDMLEK